MRWLLLVLAGFAFASDARSADEIGCRLTEKPVETVDSAQELIRFFASRNDSLAQARGDREVAFIAVNRIPTDIGELQTGSRIDLFLRILLTAALQVNEHVGAERERLLAISKLDGPSDADSAFVAKMADHYGTRPGEIEELIDRVDQVPVSLVMAQAADESGWGQSRFAREGNSLFGQHAVRGTEQPTIAADGANVRMAAFGSVCDATRAYVENLNTSNAYAGLRALRAKRRKEGAALSGTDLAGELLHYSARGAAYVSDLRAIIKRHELGQFDEAVLKGKAEPVHVRASAN